MCTKKPSWSLFDTVLVAALAPFVLMGLIGLIGALFL
jgi:preprotein translocase subunit Sss1